MVTDSIDPLFLILLHEAIPVATSKRARIMSSAPEAPGIDMVLKHWPALSDLVIEIDVSSFSPMDVGL